MPTRLFMVGSLLLCLSPALAQTPKSQVSPDDAEIVQGSTAGWIKFVIDQRTTPPTLQYMDGHTHPFHEDYLRARMPGYQTLTKAEFERVAMRNGTREVLLGAVLFPKRISPWDGIGIGFGAASAPGAGATVTPGLGGPPDAVGPLDASFGPAQVIDDYGIQLVSLDPLPFELARATCAFVRDSVVDAQGAPLGARPYYFPTPDQRDAAESQRQAFEQAGFSLGSPDRWLEQDPVYSPGWALGRLVRVPRDEVDDAYQRGDLLAGDVLLTDAAPSELPHVAGVISLSPSSDNSHAVILAQTWEIPMVFPTQASARDAIEALEGKRVLYRATDGWVSVVDMSHLPDPLVARILALKGPRAIDFPAKPAVSPGAAYWVDAAALSPADVRRVGGKAAHFGVLADTPDANSPLGLGLTSALWDTFMAQPRGAETLGEAIQGILGTHQARVQPDGSYPAGELPRLRQDLARIRGWVEDTSLPVAVENALNDALADHFAGLPADARLRFRSSSNLEDGAFSGAGLYGSFSGRARPAGSATFARTQRALRRVYASFYDERAVMERLRHRVDESHVFMGVLVHRSFPDAVEQANGVITLRGDLTSGMFDLEIASQPGEASVVRPDGDAVAERFVLHVAGWGTTARLARGSSLLPLGATVLSWSGDANDGGDYADLAARCIAVARTYATATGSGGGSVQLDMEYKRVVEGGASAFVIKQVRPLPTPSSGAVAPFVVQGPESPTFTILQGEQANAWQLHRLKCEVRGELAGGGYRVDDPAGGVFSSLQVRLAYDGEVHTRAGDPSTWADAEAVTAELSTDVSRGLRWREPGASNPRTYTLTLQTQRQVNAPLSPVLLLDEVVVSLHAIYDRPVPDKAWNGDTTLEDAARLVGPTAGEVGPTPRTITSEVADGSLRASAVLHYPPPPSGLMVGYTAPLARWGETRLAIRVPDLFPGTAEPDLTLDLEVTGPWARTLRPEHHNFGHQLLLEPALAPELSADDRARLRQAGVRRIFLAEGGSEAPSYEDFQGQLRAWPPTAAGQPTTAGGAAHGILDHLPGAGD